MGKTYKAVEITKPGIFRLVEKPVVEPGEEQVRIRVEACGVCHSDAGTGEGQLPGIVYPRVPGHEAIELLHGRAHADTRCRAVVPHRCRRLSDRHRKPLPGYVLVPHPARRQASRRGEKSRV